MDTNDVPSTVSVVPVIWSMSSLGMKPFGMIVNSAAVPIRIATENPSATGRCAITHTSVR